MADEQQLAERRLEDQWSSLAEAANEAASRFALIGAIAAALDKPVEEGGLSPSRGGSPTSPGIGPVGSSAAASTPPQLPSPAFSQDVQSTPPQSTPPGSQDSSNKSSQEKEDAVWRGDNWWWESGWEASDATSSANVIQPAEYCGVAGTSFVSVHDTSSYAESVDPFSAWDAHLWSEEGHTDTQQQTDAWGAHLQTWESQLHTPLVDVKQEMQQETPASTAVAWKSAPGSAPRGLGITARPKLPGTRGSPVPAHATGPPAAVSPSSPRPSAPVAKVRAPPAPMRVGPRPQFAAAASGPRPPTQPPAMQLQPDDTERWSREARAWQSQPAHTERRSRESHAVESQPAPAEYRSREARGLGPRQVARGGLDNPNVIWHSLRSEAFRRKEAGDRNAMHEFHRLHPKPTAEEMEAYRERKRVEKERRAAEWGRHAERRSRSRS